MCNTGLYQLTEFTFKAISLRDGIQADQWSIADVIQNGVHDLLAGFPIFRKIIKVQIVSDMKRCKIIKKIITGFSSYGAKWSGQLSDAKYNDWVNPAGQSLPVHPDQHLQMSFFKSPKKET